MKVYIFGNQDQPEDSAAIEAAKKLEEQLKVPGKKPDEVEFIFIRPNEDLPFENNENVIIMDVVEGLPGVRLIEGADIDKIILPPRSSVHDFDLGFQLKYLRKLGKLGDVKIIGIPKHGKDEKPNGKSSGGSTGLSESDYFSIHSILRKLVAQDMQGS